MRGTLMVAMALMALGRGAHAGVAVSPSLKLLAEERYDDDVLLRSAGGAGQFLTKLTSQLGAELKAPSLEASSWYAPDLLLHHGTGSVTVDHRAQLELEGTLGRRSSLRTGAQMWRVSDPTSLPRQGVARTASAVLYGKAELSLAEELSQRLQGRLGYRFEGARILEAGRLPGLYHAPFLELTYALSRRTEGGLEYRFQHFTLGGELAQAHSLANRLRYRLSRQTTLSARAGPALYWDERGGRGVVARAGLDLAHEGRRAELYFSAGQELVGASGFTAALWAQYAAVAVSARPAGALRPYASASYFRNGRAPDVGIDPLGDWSRVTQGYAVGAGLEWRLSKHLALAATADRYSQLGEVPAAGDLSRNIVAVRAVLSPW